MSENSPALTVKTWLRDAKSVVSALDAELILCEVMGFGDRSELVLREDDALTNVARKKADKMVERRQSGEPLAYILGHKDFYNRDFLVSPAVLIPRPETEQVVELALETISESAASESELQVIDVGTGSGCIAITLLAECEKRGLKADVLATDISDAALLVAKRNARKNGVKLRFECSDLLAKVEFPKDKGVLVVANLPYVDKNWEWIDKKTLEFEPETALFAEENGLALVYKLFIQFKEKCCKNYNNFMILETDTSQQADVIEFARDLGIKHRKTEGFAMLFEY